MNARIRVYSGNFEDGEKELTTESYFTYVAIDENGEPTEVPDIDIESEEGNRLYNDAVERKRKR